MREGDLVKLRVVLATNIKELRKAKGMAQERLALEAGVDRTLVSKIERLVANPSLEIMAKLANTLDISVSKLLTEKKR
jgi:transcriptional regulator with XRE-family HTH domain